MSRPAPELPFLRLPTEPPREASKAAGRWRKTPHAPGSPRRIAHLLRKCDPEEWGGTETAIERLCQGLEQQGLRSVIYCPRLQRALASEPWSEIGWSVRRFRAWVPVWGLGAAERRQRRRVGGNLLSFQLVWQLWREPGLKLIHTHTLGRLGGIALTVARARRLPLVVTIHGGVLDLPASLTDGFEGQKRGVEWGKIFGLLFRSR